MHRVPFIFGTSSTSLSAEERDFFAEVQPFGYIVFSRNIHSAVQLRALTDALKEVSGDSNIPILIDQEGGRVARILPPIAARAYPPASEFVIMAQNLGLKKAKRAVYNNYYALGKELMSFGINSNCAPVADLLHDGAHEVIGSRSFGADVATVVALCEEAVRALRVAGVAPILKHIPGHGRARCDSHVDLPIVECDSKTLMETDFKVFKELASLDCWSMTAHVKFEALDSEQCVTTSKRLIEFIRSDLGYTDNLIMTDDLSMGALSQQDSLESNMLNALSAGCDVVLHCNGDIVEMQRLVESYRHAYQPQH
jgi:beta-N-acetylhexosaminidase